MLLPSAADRHAKGDVATDGEEAKSAQGVLRRTSENVSIESLF
jgi:hypothetical protein